MKNTLRAALAAALLFSSLGCANLVIGQPIEISKTQEIREGYTTKDRVQSLFGSPLRKVPGVSGEIWIYKYLDGRGRCQELTVSFTGEHVTVYTHEDQVY